ncbi:MAG: DUF835 domain-containing protein [Candidatus Aenigmatarchaeota archaeon]
MNCLFVDGWECKVDGEEKPLDVCRVCIQAKKVANEKIKAARIARDSIEEKEPSMKKEEVSNQSSTKEEEETPLDSFESGKDDDDPWGSLEKKNIEKTMGKLESGSIYLLEDEDKRFAYELLEEINSSGKKVLFITRKHPPKLKKDYDLELEDTLWLSTSNDALAVGPNELDTLSLEMEMFLSEGGEFVFLEGLESLFSNNPNSTIIQLFQSIEDQIATNGATLVFIVTPSSIEEKHLSLINKKLDVNEVPMIEVEKETVEEPMEIPDEPLAKGDLELEEEDREVKKEALKELDDEFHKGDISVDEYLSKRAVLTSPDSNLPE